MKVTLLPDTVTFVMIGAAVIGDVVVVMFAVLLYAPNWPSRKARTLKKYCVLKSMSAFKKSNITLVSFSNVVFNPPAINGENVLLSDASIRYKNTLSSASFQLAKILRSLNKVNVKFVGADGASFKVVAEKYANSL